MTQEASDDAFAAFEEELDKAEEEQLKRFRKLVDTGFLRSPFKKVIKAMRSFTDACNLPFS